MTTRKRSVGFRSFADFATPFGTGAITRHRVRYAASAAAASAVAESSRGFRVILAIVPPVKTGADGPATKYKEREIGATRSSAGASARYPLAVAALLGITSNALLHFGLDGSEGVFVPLYAQLKGPRQSLGSVIADDDSVVDDDRSTPVACRLQA